jgi:hypothetical protein
MKIRFSKKFKVMFLFEMVAWTILGVGMSCIDNNEIFIAFGLITGLIFGIGNFELEIDK